MHLLGGGKMLGTFMVIVGEGVSTIKNFKVFNVLSGLFYMLLVLVMT